MIIGYARVSTEYQNLEIQTESIQEYADKKGERCLIFSEKESGGKENRPELQKALELLQEGDAFVVYKFDRVARSARQLHNINAELLEKGVDFVSIREDFDTTSATGKMMFNLLAMFAEFERDIIRQRTRAGLESAKRQGRVGGRPAITTKQKKQIVTLFESGERATDIATEYGIGRSTVYKIVKEGKGLET